MDDLDDFIMTRPPTANRPLLGLTVLVVEDSRFTSEALRLLCLRSGARIRRADSLHHARRHLRVYRPSVVIIDLGLPDGSGAPLISDLAQANARVDVLLGMSGDPDGHEIAMKAGADGFLAKPIINLSEFQTAILDHLPENRRPAGIRLLSGDTVQPDRLALREDLENVAGELSEPDAQKRLKYLTQFLGGLARTTDDTPLISAVDKLQELHLNGQATAAQSARVAAMVQDRLARVSTV